MGAQCLLRCSGGTGWGGVPSPCAPTPLTGAPISLGTHWEPGLDLAALHVSCLILVWRVCGPGFLPALTSEAPEAQRSSGSRTGPPSASLHQSPVTGCPGAGSAGLILLTQQACPCVPAQSCPAGSQLPAPGLMCPPTLHSLPVGLLVPTLPPGDAAAPDSPQGQGVKAPLDGRAALCSILPAPPSGPAEHVCPIPPGRGVPFFGQGDP